MFTSNPTDEIFGKTVDEQADGIWSELRSVVVILSGDGSLIIDVTTPATFSSDIRLSLALAHEFLYNDATI